MGWFTHLLVVIFTFPFLDIGNASSTPKTMTTSEINIQAIPTSMHAGLTRDLCVNCSFHSQQDSHLTALISVILSKTSATGKFAELAAVTSTSQNNVIVK